jgi:hypothetical protein
MANGLVKRAKENPRKQNHNQLPILGNQNQLLIMENQNQLLIILKNWNLH